MNAILEEDKIEKKGQKDIYIDAIVNETIQSKSISPEDISKTAMSIRNPEDRINYLNQLLSCDESNRFKYNSQFQDGVGQTINSLVQETVQQLSDLIERDSLTFLKNRKYLERREPHKDDYSVIMMDIDLFKNINDTYGHQVGDIALRAVGYIIKRSIRNTDGELVRYGGEEFYIELPNTDAKGAYNVAEIIIGRVEEFGIPVIVYMLNKAGKDDIAENIKNRTLTMSSGVAESYSGCQHTDVMENADTALYNAKEKGRNRVMLYNAGMNKNSKRKLTNEGNSHLVELNNEEIDKLMTNTSLYKNINKN